MPLLSRRSGKLLSQVAGKPHATQDDHETALPTPPASISTRSSGHGMKQEETAEADIYADPVSEDDEVPTFRNPEVILPPSAANKPAAFQASKYNTRKDEKHASLFKLPSVPSPKSSCSKRSADSQDTGSESDGPIFSSQDPPKRRKPMPNIHAPRATYGKRQTGSSANQNKAGAFKQDTKKTPPRATFKTIQGVDMFQFKGADDAAAGFQVAKVPKPGHSPCSSSLDSLLSDDFDDFHDVVEVPGPTASASQRNCSICGEEVSPEVRDDFESENSDRVGKQLSYVWQQRFCTYHKRYDAGLEWREQGYPSIDWDRLGDRLRRPKHRNHLRSVIDGDTRSIYRERMENDLRNRSKKDLEALGSRKSGTSAGYYGPRGEKLMTDFILAEFADALRDRARNDRLVTASGIQGGVSGFVQAVLVPELAVSLVREDLGPDDKRHAVDVIANSAEIGDLLNPSVNDKVHVDDDLEDE